jgi:hypothetical protein
VDEEETGDEVEEEETGDEVEEEETGDEVEEEETEVDEVEEEEYQIQDQDKPQSCIDATPARLSTSRLNQLSMTNGHRAVY